VMVANNDCNQSILPCPACMDTGCAIVVGLGPVADEKYVGYSATCQRCRFRWYEHWLPGLIKEVIVCDTERTG
jgi:hypothetical protein